MKSRKWISFFQVHDDCENQPYKRQIAYDGQCLAIFNGRLLHTNLKPIDCLKKYHKLFLLADSFQRWHFLRKKGSCLS